MHYKMLGKYPRKFCVLQMVFLPDCCILCIFDSFVDTLPPSMLNYWRVGVCQHREDAIRTAQVCMEKKALSGSSP